MDPLSMPWRGLGALVATGLFLACGVKPAPTEETIGALSQDEISACVKECKRSHGPGRHRADCIRDARHGIGECGRPRPDAGRTRDSGRDAPLDVRGDARDAAPESVDSHSDTGNPDLRSVTIDGATDRCPVITALTASTLTVTVGETITLSATAFDPDAGDTLDYSWFKISGAAVSIDPQASAESTTTVTCMGAGTVEVELSVDDGRLPDGNVRCATFETIQLNCVCPDGGCVAAPACLADGASCTPLVGPTCCNGEICALGTCGGCLDQGQGCGGGAPCCSGMTCTHGVCGGCVPDGMNCLGGAPCCSGVACTSPAVCGGPACLITGAACSGSVPCCNADTCQNGVCVSPPLAICVADGALCNGTNPCCSGKTCLGTCGACAPASVACNLAPAGCCTGETCVNGTCVQGECTPSGQPCTSGPAACCNGGCTFSNGISVCK